MQTLIIGMAIFVGIHLLPAAPTVRLALIRKIGGKRLQGHLLTVGTRWLGHDHLWESYRKLRCPLVPAGLESSSGVGSDASRINFNRRGECAR